MNTKTNLLTLIDECLERFFLEHENEIPESGLYNRIINEVEKSIFIKTLGFTNNNQSKAAKILGINRNTLRKKLETYQINV